MDVGNNLCEYRCDGEYGEARESFCCGNWQRIGDDDFFESNFSESLCCWIREDGMSCSEIHIFVRAFCFECFCGSTDASGSINHVVIEEAVFAFNITDDMKSFCNIVFWTDFVNDGEIGSDHIGEFVCFFGTSHIWSDDHEIFDFFLFEVFSEEFSGTEIVYWKVEKSLSLR